MPDSPDANSRQGSKPGSNLGREAPRPQPAPATGASAKAPLPREIGGYQIQRVLGSGGMATVYAALQKQPRRLVALKVIKAGVANESTLRRFKREIEILGKLHHPYIAQVYGAGIHEEAGDGGGVPYFVMEYIAGAKTILEYTAAKNLDLRDRIKLFVKVCAAIDHGHRNKVIHRDLKPGNILIDEFGEPKIIDFGIARAADLDLASQTLHADAGSGGLVGTLKYMAPEQVDSKPQDLDPRCDVYALGALLYKLVTNQPPHDLTALSVYEAVRVIREETPQPPSAVNPEIRGDLETIILKAMERDRTRRYRSAGSLGRDLMRFLTNKPINARRAGLIYRTRLLAQRNRTFIITSSAMIGVLALAAGIVIFGRMQRRDEKKPVVAVAPPPAQSQPAEAPPPFLASGAVGGTFNLEGHTERIARLAFVPHSAMLMSASYDHTGVLWDLSSRSPRFTFGQFKSAVMHLAVASHGSTAALAPNGGPIVVVDVQTGAVKQTLKIGTRSIQSLALSPSGDRIAYSCDDLTLRLSDVDGANEMILRGTTGAFDCIAFGLDGAQIAAGADSGDVYIWNVADGAPRARLSQLRGPVAVISFIAPPRSYSTSMPSSGFGGDSTPPAIQEAAAQPPIRLIAILHSGSAAIWSFAPGGEPATTSNWNVLTGSAEPGAHPLMDACLDPESRWLVCADTTQIRLWDVTVDPPLQMRAAPLKPRADPYALAIDSIPSWCAVGQVDGDITIYPVAGTP